MATCTRDGWRPNPLCQGIVKLTCVYDNSVFLFYHHFVKLGEDIFVLFKVFSTKKFLELHFHSKRNVLWAFL